MFSALQVSQKARSKGSESNICMVLSSRFKEFDNFLLHSARSSTLIIQTLYFVCYLCTAKYSHMTVLNNKWYLALYCLIFMGVGLFANSLGPLIPYLAELRHKHQTEYSFLFMAVASGNLIGIVGYQFISRLHILNLQHKILISVGVIYAIFMNVFMLWQSTIGEWICMSFFGLGYYFFDTALNICLLLVCGQSGGSWIPFAHGFYGVGALLSPQVVRLLQTNTYFAYSVLYLVIAALSYYFPNPDHDDIHSEKSEKKEETQDKKPIQWKAGPKQLQLQFCLGFLLIAGLEQSFAGWIPSYAVLTDVSSRSNATIFGTIFWGSSTIFRFVIASMSMLASRKVKLLVFSLFMCGIVCLVILQAGIVWFTVLFSSLSFGVTSSAIFPLLISLPAEYEIRFKPSQIANMMMTAVLSSGGMPGITGMLMGWSIDVMFFWLALLAGLLLVDLKFIFSGMQNIRKEKNSGAKEIELQEKILNE